MRKRKLLSMLHPQAPPLQRWLVSLCLVVLGAFAMNAQAAKFDEKFSLKPWSTTELADNASKYFDPLESGDVTPIDALRSDDMFGRWMSLRIQVGWAVDAGRSLEPLAKYGLMPQGDGKYEVDLTKFPYWSPLHDTLSNLLAPQAIDRVVEQLKVRGFQDGDVRALRTYLESNSLDARRIRASNVLETGFMASAVARHAKTPTVEQVRAFHFQRRIADAEETRTWALVLLNSLEPRAQRILASYAVETGRIRSFTAEDANETAKQVAQAIRAKASEQTISPPMDKEIQR
jgi:hypothetical protein